MRSGLVGVMNTTQGRFFDFIVRDDTSGFVAGSKREEGGYWDASVEGWRERSYLMLEFVLLNGE